MKSSQRKSICVWDFSYIWQLRRWLTHCRTGVGSSWPALVKTSSESRDKWGEREMAPLLQPHCVIWAQAGAKAVGVLPLPSLPPPRKSGLPYIWISSLHQCLGLHRHLNTHNQEDSGAQRQVVTAYSPQLLSQALGHGTWWLSVSRIHLHLLYPNLCYLKWGGGGQWRRDTQAVSTEWESLLGSDTAPLRAPISILSPLHQKCCSQLKATLKVMQANSAV